MGGGETVSDPFRPLRQSDLPGIAGDMMRGYPIETIAEMKKMDISCLRCQIYFHREKIVEYMVAINYEWNCRREIRRDRSAERMHPRPYRDKNYAKG